MWGSMIHYVNGDLFDTDAEIIAHGCNCRGGYGSGVAGIMAKKYPKARHYYLDKYDEEGWKLGDVQFVTQWNGKVIANCATQDAYYPRDRVHADYDAIKICMEKVKQFAKSKNMKIAIPKIGAGLAGGDWNKIVSILNDVFSDYDVTIYYL
jgi:O-acetyl-ADP-ribose deacetylase (regulator of RNase III)